jgi:hypothetical protein
MKTTIYAAIDAVQFTELCAGKSVTIEGVSEGHRCDVKLILSDIGFDVMQNAVDRAVHRAQAHEQG